MLETFDLSRKRTAVLDNAYEVTETIKLNGVSQLTFKIPSGDEKVKYCKKRHFVRYNGGEQYRIIDFTADQSSVGVSEYVCEHCIATLCDTLMFQDHILTGYTTREAIEYVLSQQNDWVLGECDFDFRFDYAWSSENLLNALLSIATPFVDAYKWEFNTKAYPWILSLRRLDLNAKPQFYVFAGLNFLSSRKSEFSSEVVTRIYPLGYGEGINQLDIRSVNNGVPYLQSPQEVLDEYGLIEAVYVDRSYEEPASLKAAAQAILEGMQTPRIEYTADIADLYELTRNEYARAEIGKVIMFKDDEYKTYITEISRNHDTEEMTLTLANKPMDLVSTIADLADRQRIEATYSQGATQLWGSPLQDNATKDRPLTYRLWIPPDTKIMNRVQVKIELNRARAYSQTTEYGGGGTETSEANGGVSKSTAAGGGTSVTSGASSRRTSSVASDTGRVSDSTEPVGSDYDTHYHRVSVPLIVHSHEIDHTHTVGYPSHTHDFSIPNHRHDVEFPAHAHNISFGIFESTASPSSATVYVNNAEVFSMGTTYEGDITKYLIAEDGLIPRGQWLEISVKPNIPAYVTISVAAQGFIQSKGGGQY